MFEPLMTGTSIYQPTSTNTGYISEQNDTHSNSLKRSSHHISSAYAPIENHDEQEDARSGTNTTAVIPQLSENITPFGY